MTHDVFIQNCQLPHRFAYDETLIFLSGYYQNKRKLRLMFGLVLYIVVLRHLCVVSVGKEKRMQIRLLLQRLGKSNPVMLDSIGVPASLAVFITEYMETFSGVHEMWPT